MIQAWTEDGPTTYDGEFYNYRYLNVWPKPVPEALPSCYIVGTGSPETIDFAAQRGWGYSAVFTPKTQQIKTFKALRETMPKYGHEMTPDKAHVQRHRLCRRDPREGREGSQGAHQVLLHRRRPDDAAILAPPGYLSLDQFRIRAGAATKMHGGFDWDE